MSEELCLNGEESFWGDEWGKFWGGGEGIAQSKCLEEEIEWLPRGLAWTRDPCTWMGRVLDADAVLNCDFEGKIETGFNKEMFPWTCEQMIPEWFKFLGLPDPCYKPETIPEKQAAILAKLLARFGTDTQDFYKKIAEALGFTIEFEWQGQDVLKVGKTFHRRIGHAGLNYVWIIKVSGTGIKDALECLFNEYKPVHIVFIFDYI